MTDLDLDAIEARANAATDGPWRADDEHGLMPGATPAWCVSATDADGDAYLGDVAWMPQDGDTERPNAEFIAHARTDVPALVAALREARAESQRATSWHMEALDDLATCVAERDDEPCLCGTDFTCLARHTTDPQTQAVRYGDEHRACVEESDRLIRERDDWRRRYEALRDGVLAWSFDPVTRENEDGTRSIIWPDKADLRAVVARVEGGENA